MGKSTGFLEYDRTSNANLPPLERIQNYEEFRIPAPDKERMKQAARCMDCGIPFCQSGVQYSGSFSGCPLHNLVPEWNDEIYNGNWKEALSRLLKTNNFPEFTGRVCPALCEAACTCSLDSDAVTVHDNELAIIEKGFSRGWIRPCPPRVRSGRSVAVIGSGPSGLAAADCLNRRGHSVTVFEQDDQPGGLLMYGIPNMKLDKSVVQRRIALMKEEGVLFRTGCRVDAGTASPEAGCSHVRAGDVLEQFDAVILCCGSRTERDLEVPGRDSRDVLFALDYLSASQKALFSSSLHDPHLSAEGKDVLVIGSGDTANDCLATAIRQGCRSVVQICRSPKLPEERTKNNPWPQWPRINKTDYGQQEASALFGKDPRRFQTNIKELRTDENGNLKEAVIFRTRQQGHLKNGRPKMIEIEGSEEVLPCNMLLIALGFTGCEKTTVRAFGVGTDRQGRIQTQTDPADPDRIQCRTEIPKLFAAGDARRGSSLVVWAIAEGRACAKEVDEFLMGYSNM